MTNIRKQVLNWAINRLAVDCDHAEDSHAKLTGAEVHDVAHMIASTARTRWSIALRVVRVDGRWTFAL